MKKWLCSQALMIVQFEFVNFLVMLISWLQLGMEMWLTSGTFQLFLTHSKGSFNNKVTQIGFFSEPPKFYVLVSKSCVPHPSPICFKSFMNMSQINNNFFLYKLNLNLELYFLTFKCQIIFLLNLLLKGLHYNVIFNSNWDWNNLNLTMLTTYFNSKSLMMLLDLD